MRTTTLSFGVVLGAFAVLVYVMRDHPSVASLLDRVRPPQVAQPGASGAPGAGAKKCTGGGRVVYTNEACPPGLREESVGGALSIVPATPRPPASTKALPTRGERLNEAISRP